MAAVTDSMSMKPDLKVSEEQCLPVGVTVGDLGFFRGKGR
jgi:hypothetical protein